MGDKTSLKIPFLILLPSGSVEVRIFQGKLGQLSYIIDLINRIWQSWEGDNEQRLFNLNSFEEYLIAQTPGLESNSSRVLILAHIAQMRTKTPADAPTDQTDQTA